MNQETFKKVKASLLKKASKVMRDKEEEYLSTYEVLGNFKQIAKFREKQTPETIMDLVSKQLVSISSTINSEFGVVPPIDLKSMEFWDEKFVNSINYLLKLYASIYELRD